MKFDIDHIGIAVENLQSVLDSMRDAFDKTPDFIEEISDQKVKIAGFHIGNQNLEYFEPLTEDSPIKRFLKKRGNGIHHIAFTVDNIEMKLKELRDKGFQLIDESPRIGAKNKRIAFLHPKSFNGILIELCENEYSGNE